MRNSVKTLEDFFQSVIWKDLEDHLVVKLTLIRQQIENLELRDDQHPMAYAMIKERLSGKVDALRELVNAVPIELIEAAKSDFEEETSDARTE